MGFRPCSSRDFQTVEGTIDNFNLQHFFTVDTRDSAMIFKDLSSGLLLASHLPVRKIETLSQGRIDMYNRILIFGLLGTALAGAKTYTITLTGRAQAGQTQLEPGDYRLKVDGSAVVLMKKSGQQVDATAKVEEAGQEFDHSSVHVSETDSVRRVESIQLGGTNYNVLFQ